MGKRKNSRWQNNRDESFKKYEHYHGNMPPPPALPPSQHNIYSFNDYNEYYGNISGPSQQDQNFRYSRNRKFFEHSTRVGPRYAYNFSYGNVSNQFKQRQHSNQVKKKKRSPSPQEGTEKHTEKKIAELSMNIMQQLMNPSSEAPKKILPTNKPQKESEKNSNTNHKVPESMTSKTKKNQIKKPKIPPNTAINKEHVTEKIMTHLSNLDTKKKQTFINSKSTVYDSAIEKIMQQKRLELSRVLRNYYSRPNAPPSDDLMKYIDEQIQLEDLPSECFDEIWRIINDAQNVNEETGGSSSHLHEINDNLEGGEVLLNVLDNIINKFDSNEVMEVKQENRNDNNCKENDYQNWIEPENIKEEVEISIEPTVIVKTITEIDEDDKKDILVDHIILDEATTERKQILKEDKETNTENVLCKETIDVSVQTKGNDIIADILETSFKEEPATLTQAIGRMVKIDKWIRQLAKYRRNIFIQFNKKRTTLSPKIKKAAKAKAKNSSENNFINNKINDCEIIEPAVENMIDDCEGIGNTTECTNEMPKFVENISFDEKIFSEIKKKLCHLNRVILYIKRMDDKLLIGSDQGKVLVFNLKKGQLFQEVQFSNSDIKSVLISHENNEMMLFAHLFDSSIQRCNLSNPQAIQKISESRKVFCSESKWGYIFLGCAEGLFLRYSVKRDVCEFEDTFYGNAILDIKATVEGARKILVMVSHDYPVCFRDAMTGLELRLLQYNYSNIFLNQITIENSYIYCSGEGFEILIFSFHEGRIIKKINVSNGGGQIIFKIYKNLLFATGHSCDISVYDTNSGKMLQIIDGPGGVISSMEIIDNQILIATCLLKFEVITIPETFLSL